MEIRNYVRIIWRRLWLIAGLPAMILVLSLLRQAAPPAQAGFVATMRFSVGVAPEAAGQPFYRYDSYYTWLTAEYLTDDLSEIIKSREVAEAVIAEATRRGLKANIAPGAIQGASGSGKQHRILTVSLRWPKADELAILADSLASVLSEGQAPYFDEFRTAGTPVVMHLIDSPGISPIGVSTRGRLELPLRLALALFAGLAGAFLLEYLDTSVHGPEDLLAHELDIVGVIPRPNSLPWTERRLR